MNKKRDRKRAEIIKAAQKRFIRHGLNKTTMDEIARDLRIGKSTLYTYFSSKEEIYFACIDSEISNYFGAFSGILAAAESQPEEKVRDILRLKSELGQNCRLFYKSMLLFLTGETTQAEDTFIRQFIETEAALAVKLTEQLQRGTKKGAAIDGSAFAIQSIAVPLILNFYSVLSEKELRHQASAEEIENFIQLCKTFLPAPGSTQA